MTTRPYAGRQPALYAALQRLRDDLDPWSDTPKTGLVEKFKTGLAVMVTQRDRVAVRVADSFRAVESIAAAQLAHPEYLAMITAELARMDADANPVGPDDVSSWCPTCRTKRRIVDEFDAVVRAFARINTYWVIILECGHSTSTRLGTEPAEGAPYVDPVDYP